MANVTVNDRDARVLLQSRQLLEQGRSINLSSRDERMRSRDRLQAFFEGLQDVLRPAMTLEIGAHAAPFSQRMARLGREAHAFEANPYNYKAFVRQIRRRAPEVRYHHLAISDTDGSVTFEVKESRSGRPVKKIVGNNSLLRRTSPDISYESVTVPSARLDTFLARRELEGRSFSAWIDVEGALGIVTAGFGSAIRSCLSLIVEVEDIAFWQGQMLAADAMHFFDSQGMVPVARDFEAPHQYNLVYLRQDILGLPEVSAAIESYVQSL